MSRMSELHAELAARDEQERDAAPDMLDALQSARAWVQHWQRDAACHLVPTDNSLRDALSEIEIAIVRAGGRLA